MTQAVKDATPATDAPDVSDELPVRYAPWGLRLAALAVDVIPGAMALVTTGLVLYTTAPGSWLRWTLLVVFAVVLVAMAVNRVVLPAVKGWTLGRAVCGIRVVRSDGGRVGVVRMELRDVAHGLDTAAAFTGWLWPLWDSRNRTFADMLSRTEVRVVPEVVPNARRMAALSMVIATLLSAVVVGLGYLAVYRPDRATDVSRTEIAEQGPRIVEQLLSYRKGQVAEDFAAAQALTTEGYRDQLIAQQQSVQQDSVTTNEYWAVSSAVVSVEPERAAMLMALQGQRGDNPNDLRFITATVRVEFEKTDDKWLVSGLSVLKKPKLPTSAPQAPAGSGAPASPAPSPQPKPTQGGAG